MIVGETQENILKFQCDSICISMLSGKKDGWTLEFVRNLFKIMFIVSSILWKKNKSMEDEDLGQEQRFFQFAPNFESLTHP